MKRSHYSKTPSLHHSFSLCKPFLPNGHLNGQKVFDGKCAMNWKIFLPLIFAALLFVGGTTTALADHYGSHGRW
jgi:hypothetical protein